MGNILSSIFKSIFPSLAEQAKYITELESNLKGLIDDILKLEARSADVGIQVEIQKRQGLQPLEEVLLWLSQVEAIGPQVLLVIDASAVELQRLCMYGYCSSDFKLTYFYGKEVYKKLEIVKGLLFSSQAFEVVARSGLPPDMEEVPTRDTVGLENMLEATWNCLMEDKVGILGLYGMGGVGKTTLLEQINNKFLETRDEFHVVISVVVSQDLQIGRIQNEIGRRLGLYNMEYNMEWEQKPEKEKASGIKKVLAMKRFVILLDDIWRKVNLEDIGIPLPSTENRSKVVFTTRSKKVCGRMGDIIEMEVKCLDSVNAWKLFQKKVRANTLASDPKIPELARIVCGKCKGLPLALSVIGETMACKTTVHEWQDAINVLDLYAAENPEVKDEILKVLKFSYDDLKDERVKQCFQYCALFPEDHNIEKEMLVDYWICEGILNGRGDREKALNQGYGIICVLVNSCLLTNQEDETVKMHDVVRQMALWIATNSVEKKEIFVVQTGARLHQMPEVSDWNAVRRMSLQNNEIKDISCTPDYPNLMTLLLQRNKLVNISGGFFLLMPKLVVLDLSLNEDLNKLPEEVSELVSLRYLNLSGTKLEKLPAGLIKLIQLRYLNLDGMYTLSSISGISSLVNLETLMLCNSTLLSVELIEDIKLLKNLKVLSVTINNHVILKCLLSLPILASCIKDIFLFKMKAIAGVSFAQVMANLRNLVIQQCSIYSIMEHTGYGRRCCFQNLKFVQIFHVPGLRDLTCLLFAPNLTSLHVLGPSLELEEIISREKVSRIMNEGSSITPFQKLRTLALANLKELNSIYWVSLDFPSLTLITIAVCPKLKKLPFNRESFKGNHIRLVVDYQEWFEEIQWEDEAIKDRLLHSHQVIPYGNSAARSL